MNSFKLSVAILSWNRKDALGICLRSVERQSIFPDIETIVLDSNSTDGSLEFVKNNFSWVRLIKWDKNPGLAEGRNLLVQFASAPIVFWMDDDCELVEDDALEKMLNLINTNKQIGIVYAKILEGYNGNSFPHLFIPSSSNKQKFVERCLVTSSFASGGTCVRRDLFINCKGYDKGFFRMNVENDLSFRIYNSGYYICYYPDATIIHRPHSQGRDYNVIMYYSIRNKLWGFWKNLPFSWAFICTSIELPMAFLRTVQRRTFKSWFFSVKDAFTGLYHRRHLRKAISSEGLNIWAFLCHNVVEWEDKIPEIPPYSLTHFIINEIKFRILSRLCIK